MLRTDLLSAVSYLRRREMLPILKIQTTVLTRMQEFMVKKRFIQLMPVITAKVTDPLGPDPGSSIVAFPKIKYYDEELLSLIHI